MKDERKLGKSSVPRLLGGLYLRMEGGGGRQGSVGVCLSTGVIGHAPDMLGSIDGLDLDRHQGQRG